MGVVAGDVVQCTEIYDLVVSAAGLHQEEFFEIHRHGSKLWMLVEFLKFRLLLR